ncbi:hypothetical protein FOZ60_014490 [Perkinsus olseni]|uniref:Uncharacterized protein n=3 Tax=Perkinsus olseni TaxID=32597 RepID=A0A7J6N7N9_PEROL|nr:hypothetical protein FOZ60_014490 [Perkinsus olseni]
MVVIEATQPFRTLGAIHIRKKRVLEKLAESGQAWRAGEDEESLLESLRPKNPKCFKCNLSMKCPMCNRDECSKCGGYMKCPKCAGLVKGSIVPALDGEVRGFVETKSAGTQYSERDFKKHKSKAQLRNALGTDQEGEAFGDDEKDEKDLRIDELQKQIDDLNEEMGRVEEERDKQEERAEVYREKYNEMRKDWDVEQRSRVKLEAKIGDFMGQLRYLSDVAGMYQGRLTQTRVWAMRTIEERYGKVWDMLLGYGRNESRAMERMVVAAWKSAVELMKVERSLAESESRYEMVKRERDLFEAEQARLRDAIVSLEEVVSAARDRLKAAGYTVLDKVLNSQPGGKLCYFFGLWKMGHAASVAESKLNQAYELAAELKERQKEYELALKRVEDLSEELTKVKRKGALREMEARKLRPLANEVLSLKRQLVDVEEARVRQLDERDGILIERKKELQELQQIMLNDVHAQALQAHILHLNEKIAYERLLRMRAAGAGLLKKSFPLLMCMKCQKLVVYRKEAKMMADESPRKQPHNSLLPPLKVGSRHCVSDGEDSIRQQQQQDFTQSGGGFDRSLMSYSSDPESELSFTRNVHGLSDAQRHTRSMIEAPSHQSSSVPRLPAIAEGGETASSRASSASLSRRWRIP